MFSECVFWFFVVGKDVWEIKIILFKGCLVMVEGLVSDKLGYDYFNCG